MLITDCSAGGKFKRSAQGTPGDRHPLHRFLTALPDFDKDFHHISSLGQAMTNDAPMTKGIGTAKTSAVVKPTGILKWLNELKGFGLITPDDGSKDLFANFPVRTANDKPSGLKVKQRVSYTVQLGPDGDQAVNVKSIA